MERRGISGPKVTSVGEVRKKRSRVASEDTRNEYIVVDWQLVYWQVEHARNLFSSFFFFFLNFGV